MGLCLAAACKYRLWRRTPEKNASGEASTKDVIEAVRLAVFTPLGSPFDRHVLAQIRLPGRESRGGGPAFATDVVGEGRFQIAEHALKRDPNQDLVSHSGALESFRCGFVDHRLTFGVLHQIEELQIQSGIDGAHL